MIDFEFSPSVAHMLKELEAMEAGLGQKAQQQALAFAAAPVKKAIKRHAPTKTGALKKSIGHRKFKAAERAELGIAPDDAAIYIGPKNKLQYRANWIENTGAKAHVIKPRRKSTHKYLRFYGTFAKKVSHPGMKAKPFISTGWEQTDEVFQTRFFNKVQKFMGKASAKPA
ncbi:MAG: HK97 gp10 family phage protein [Candidatus Reddybacter sp.]